MIIYDADLEKCSASPLLLRFPLYIPVSCRMTNVMAHCTFQVQITQGRIKTWWISLRSDCPQSEEVGEDGWFFFCFLLTVKVVSLNL